MTRTTSLLTQPGKIDFDDLSIDLVLAPGRISDG
jgi:hypothetical protein